MKKRARLMIGIVITLAGMLCLWGCGNEMQNQESVSPVESEENIVYAMPPQIRVNSVSYQHEKVVQEKDIDTELVCIGEITSVCPLNELPTEDMQSNHGLLGTKIYEFQEGLILFYNDEFHLYMAVPSDENNIVNETKNYIDFEYFFRGFTLLWQDYEYMDEMYEILGGCLIYSEEDWIDYKDKFCTAAGPYDTPDFSEKCFLALPALYGSRPSANSSFVIDSIEVEKNGLSVRIAESTPENTIYVENANGVGHLFVNVIVLNRSDIPENVEYPIYVKSTGEM